jgi:iron complex transport system substrate-binding protein
MRICSLLPSATEIVADLGLTDALVGRSAECDHPPSVTSLPVVTSARVDTSVLASHEIDAAVRAALRSGESLYTLDADLVEELRPDLILTQDLCKVCAVSSGDVLCAVDVPVLAFDPQDVAGIYASVESLARELGVEERGRELVRRARDEVELVRVAVEGRRRPRVFVAEWLDPPFAPGHWLPQMVELAGGKNVLGRAGRPSFPTTWAAVAAREPELLILAPCGFDARRAAEEARGIDLPARAVAVDANAHFSRPTLRVAAGIRQLAALLHPDVVDSPLPAVDVTGVAGTSRRGRSAGSRAGG